MASHLDLNILVVDDDVFIRKIVQDRLKMEGYTVTTAEDGEAGWEKFLENTYQLVITDINMPRINGVELLNKILATKIKVPTVVMSGGLSKAMESLVKETGASAFLRKPFSIKDLVNVVSSELNRVDNDKNETTEEPEKEYAVVPLLEIRNACDNHNTSVAPVHLE